MDRQQDADGLLKEISRLDVEALEELALRIGGRLEELRCSPEGPGAGDCRKGEVITFRDNQGALRIGRVIGADNGRIDIDCNGEVFQVHATVGYTPREHSERDPGPRVEGGDTYRSVSESVLSATVREIAPTRLYTSDELHRLLRGFVNLETLRRYGLRSPPRPGVLGASSD